MATIEVTVEINATDDKVWEIISDIDNEPKFWKGTKNVKNISKNDNVIHREVTIAFRDQKCLQEVTLEPKRKIDAKFTKGIINGSKTMTISTKEEQDNTCYLLGHEINRNNGDVYRCDKKSHQKWHRTSYAKYQRRSREIINGINF